MLKPELELLPFARVSKQVGLGRSNIYQRIKEETFPRPVSLGAHCVRWRSDEIDAWIKAQTTRADTVQANAERAKKASSARQLKAQTASADIVQAKVEPAKKVARQQKTKQPAVISSAQA